MQKIPFSKTYISEQSRKYIDDLLSSGNLESDGFYSQSCLAWLREYFHCDQAYLTPSCTAALEMSALLCEIKPGDEVILPSYTFSSTANAFVLRGATPVFVDICPETLNIDPVQIKLAFTNKTKAVIIVHYAGVSCDMQAIQELTKQNQCWLIEDCAQTLGASYKGKPLGVFGDISCFSFHYTKNIISGEGGACLINNPQWQQRAEILREKGTNRSKFIRGEVDKYTWVDLGSSYLPSEFAAACLRGQLEEMQEITQKRLQVWQQYHQGLEGLEQQGKLRRPIIPDYAKHNAHMYYILLNDEPQALALQSHLSEQGMQATSHYVPLHSSPYGKKIGRSLGSMQHTNKLSKTILRLPMYVGVGKYVPKVIDSLNNFFAANLQKVL